ncbi:hypothetical protein KC325_g266 [Hortaea werneckii]|nr:hypothetical protein KC325_g266 [Hortaea werneckii]
MWFERRQTRPRQVDAPGGTWRQRVASVYDSCVVDEPTTRQQLRLRATSPPPPPPPPPPSIHPSCVRLNSLHSRHCSAPPSSPTLRWAPTPSPPSTRPPKPTSTAMMGTSSLPS